jgi:hypothetical protein
VQYARQGVVAIGQYGGVVRYGDTSSRLLLSIGNLLILQLVDLCVRVSQLHVEPVCQHLGARCRVEIGPGKDQHLVRHRAAELEINDASGDLGGRRLGKSGPLNYVGAVVQHHLRVVPVGWLWDAQGKCVLTASLQSRW